MFDNINLDKQSVYGRYQVIHTFDELRSWFQTSDDKFIVCIANPLKRERLVESVLQLGGKLTSYVAVQGSVLHPETPVGEGCVLQAGVLVSKDVSIGRSVFINAGVIIGHDCVVEDYVSLGPGCRLLGGSTIGAFSYVGCNAVVMPGVKIGKKVRVGVGKVVTEDLPDNAKFM
jgi:UDP-perosamine 4-acetyltransferase